MRRRAPTTSPSSISSAWIQPLAKPYLRGYRAVAERRGSLRGYWFLHPGSDRGTPGKRQSAAQAGFFVGFLVAPADFGFLSPETPECVVFTFVRPVGGPLHRRLVRRPQSLLRKTFVYIRWLTHRPPRFAFYEDQLPAMVRHLSMRDWPRDKYEHFSRNFFIEALAWLVRSGLVRKLLAEAPGPTAPGGSRPAKGLPPSPRSKHSGRSSSR